MFGTFQLAACHRAVAVWLFARKRAANHVRQLAVENIQHYVNVTVQSFFNEDFASIRWF